MLYLRSPFHVPASRRHEPEITKGRTLEDSIPVAIRGVVTCFDRARQILFVQDATGGIYVYGVFIWLMPLKVGQEVTITGRTDPGEFTPVVQAARVDVTGSTPLPPVPDLDFLTFLSARRTATATETDL
jgi:hypothetical protein